MAGSKRAAPRLGLESGLARGRTIANIRCKGAMTKAGPIERLPSPRAVAPLHPALPLPGHEPSFETAKLFQRPVTTS
jgi:hypothetical protein